MISTTDVLPERSLGAARTRLTPREVAVLALIAQGLSNRGIAAQLFVCEKSIEAVNRAIFLKLGLGFKDEFENRRVKAVLAFQAGSALPFQLTGTRQHDALFE